MVSEMKDQKYQIAFDIFHFAPNVNFTLMGINHPNFLPLHYTPLNVFHYLENVPMRDNIQKE